MGSKKKEKEGGWLVEPLRVGVGTVVWSLEYRVVGVGERLWAPPTPIAGSVV